MQGIITNFRGSKRRKRGNQMIVIVDGIANKEKAKPLVGKTVIWQSPAKKEIKGTVRAAHGNKGALRVLFEKGMPGQAIGNKVEIKI